MQLIRFPSIRPNAAHLSMASTFRSHSYGRRSCFFAVVANFWERAQFEWLEDIWALIFRQMICVLTTQAHLLRIIYTFESN